MPMHRVRLLADIVLIALISRQYRVVATLVVRVLAPLVETVIPMRWRPVLW